jgi:hypothetical protein
MARVIEDRAGYWRRLDERIEGLSAEIDVLARTDSGCERSSSAMVAAIGTGDAFTKGRDFAAWLGLVPRQMSTGDRTILGKISKRGNRYLRILFASVCKRREDRTSMSSCSHSTKFSCDARPDHTLGQTLRSQTVFAPIFVRYASRSDQAIAARRMTRSARRRHRTPFRADWQSAYLKFYYLHLGLP